MASGNYTFIGRDSDPFTTIDAVDSAGMTIDDAPSGGDGTLTVGDAVLIDAGAFFTGGATYQGTDGAGGAVFLGSDSNIYVVSNATINVGDSYSVDAGSDFVICFAAGTLIATPDGEVAVETLSIGDQVMTADGRSVPVKWMGRQTVAKLFSAPERFRPVRIAAGALGDGIPHTDLVVTKDHGFPIDGIVVHAGALVNGTSITEVPMDELGDTETYWHVETEGHEVIVANGAPAETFVDNTSRRRFDNYAEFEAAFGADQPEMAEIDLPRAVSARQVPREIREKLERRAEALGMALKRPA